MPVTFIEPIATFCIKVIPGSGGVYFLYVDASSTEAAERIAKKLCTPDEGNKIGDFAQLGIFYTNVELHEPAKEKYLQR